MIIPWTSSQNHYPRLNSRHLWGCWDWDGDEPPHQIHSYTLLFLLFHHFLYIVNPPLCTPALMWPHTITLALASSDWSCLFDGHMVYDSHVFTSILSISNVHPPTVWPIMSPHTLQSGTFYSFASDEPYAPFLICHSYWTCLYLPFTPIEQPHNCLYQFPPELRISTYALYCLALILHHFALHCTALELHCLYPTPHLEMIPCPQITPSEPHRIYT